MPNYLTAESNTVTVNADFCSVGPRFTQWKYGQNLKQTETTLSTVINYTFRQQPCGEGSDAMKFE